MIRGIASGVVSVTLSALVFPACASGPGTTEASYAHQYKYVPAVSEANVSSASPIVGKSRIEERTRDEVVAVYRRPDPPPPRPPSEGRSRPPKPSK